LWARPPNGLNPSGVEIVYLGDEGRDLSRVLGVGGMVG